MAILFSCALFFFSCAGTRIAEQSEQPKTSTQSVTTGNTGSNVGVQPTSSSAVTMQEYLRRQEELRNRDPKSYDAISRATLDYYIRGSALQMQNNYAEAILEFQQALRYQPSTAGFFAIAECYGRLSKYDLAVEFADKTLALDSSFLPAYKLKAEVQIVQLKLADATETYEHIVRREPSNDNRFTLARLYEVQQPARALIIYEQLLHSSSNPEILARYADFARAQGKYQQAIAVLEKLIDLTDRDEAVFPVLLDSYLQAKDYGKAHSALKTYGSTLNDQDYARAYFTLGDALSRALDSSIYAKQTALLFSESIPQAVMSFWQAPLLCGTLRYDQGDTILGEQYFRQALEYKDSSGTIALQIANSYLKARAWQSMVRVLQPRLKYHAKDVRYPLFLGFAYTQLQNTIEAIRSFEHCVSLDSNMMDAWSNLGMLYNALGNHTRSDRAYERALLLDSNSAIVNNNYAYALSERGLRLQRAEAMSKKALYAEPNNASYLDTMGWILYKLGNAEQALPFIQKAINAGDASATVYEHLGDVYEALKNLTEARKAWHEALKKDPNRASTQHRLQKHEQSK